MHSESLGAAADDSLLRVDKVADETSTKYFRIYLHTARRNNRLFFGGTWGERDLMTRRNSTSRYLVRG